MNRRRRRQWQWSRERCKPLTAVMLALCVLGAAVPALYLATGIM